MSEFTSTVPRSAPVSSARAGRDPLRWFVLLLCLLFVLQGLALIPYPGVQNDEALFAAGIYRPLVLYSQVRIFHHDVPLMLMSYMGALKVWLYAAIFSLWAPSVFSVRVPVLLVGAVTVWLLWLFVRDTLGRRAALIACALLATDTSFLLTTCFDWGPVALLHLLLLAALLALARFHRTGAMALLAAGFFLLGLALWEKAIFGWVLVGLAAATVVVFPRALVARLTWRNLAVAAAAFLLGAAPLVRYNVKNKLITFRGNAHYSSAGLDNKANMVRITLEGSSMFGYLPRDEPPPQPARPRNVLERASLAVSDLFGQPRAGLLFAALVLALLLLPLVWRTPARRAMLFSVVFMAVTWVQMAFLKDAGGGSHHVVLLWPFPHVMIAAALAQASRVRRAAAVLAGLVVAVAAGDGLLVTNEHLAQFIRNGSSLIWTDAIHPLAETAAKLPAQRVFVMDWGIMDALRALDRGRLPLLVGSDPFMTDTMSVENRRAFQWMVSGPDSLFIGHAAGNEILAGVSARFERAAREAGFTRQTLAVIADRMGRPVFEIYRMVRSSTTAYGGPPEGMWAFSRHPVFSSMPSSSALDMSRKSNHAEASVP